MRERRRSKTASKVYGRSQDKEQYTVKLLRHVLYITTASSELQIRCEYPSHHRMPGQI